MRIGAWLFRRRTLIPLPLAAAILLLRVGQTQGSTLPVAAGVLLTAAGEALRLWGVHHIGVISRTRSARVGPLVAAGPFAFVRNPLYLGNIALWAGFALIARLVWLVPVAVVVLVLVYDAIVRWEERLLDDRLGDAYRSYAARVPRWLPAFNRGDGRDLDVSVGSGPSAVERGAFTWRATLFSERGTLIAMLAGYALLWLKARF
jgi:protein-S-isoprenylcysteine O-methyltransferase Ste14